MWRATLMQQPNTVPSDCHLLHRCRGYGLVSRKDTLGHGLRFETNQCGKALVSAQTERGEDYGVIGETGSIKGACRFAGYIPRYRVGRSAQCAQSRWSETHDEA